MTRRFLTLGVGSLLLLTVCAFAKLPEPAWPKVLGSCPAFVQLNATKLKNVDGRKNGTNRLRPWPDKSGKTQHTDLVIENLRLHHFENEKAIMVNTGSPDKPRVKGQVASYKSVLFRNLDIGPVYRTQPGIHMDHIWIGAGHDSAFRPECDLRGCLPSRRQSRSHADPLRDRRTMGHPHIPPSGVGQCSPPYRDQAR